MSRIFARLGWGVGWVTALGALGYLLLYVYRWEWHRALVAGIVLIAVELALTGGLLARRIGDGAGSPGERTRPVRSSGSPPPHDFAWLDPRHERHGVFIPLLLGGGVLVSGLAWMIERITGALSSSTDEGSLPEGYDSIAYPGEALVPSDDEVRVHGLPARDDEHLRRLLGPYAHTGTER